MKYALAILVLAILSFVGVQSYRAYNAAKVSTPSHQVALCENPACGNK